MSSWYLLHLSRACFSRCFKKNQTIHWYNFYPGRFQKRSADVSCDDIDRNPREACEMYHFRCQACANDTILLQHSKTILFIKSYWHRNIEVNEIWTKIRREREIRDRERESCSTSLLLTLCNRKRPNLFNSLLLLNMRFVACRLWSCSFEEDGGH